MDKNPHISIILPVFNAQETLPQCIESILGQTFTDFELIIVNDGSTDDSLSVCVGYEVKDCRIQVIDQPNKGVSAARNMGLDHARGQYICFVDADDWVQKDYLVAFFVTDTNPHHELIIQNCFETTQAATTLKLTFEDIRYGVDDFTLLFSELGILSYGYPFAKLYERDIIEKHGLRFDSRIHFIEDLLFLLHYIQYIHSVRFVSQAYYHYRLHPHDRSLSYSHNPYESEIRAYYAQKDILERLTRQFALSPLSVHYWKANNGYVFYRAIRTMYRPLWKKPFAQRIRILKQQWNTENVYCLKAYTDQSINEHLNKIAVVLYLRKWILLYDWYMGFFIFIRYRVSFLWRLFRKDRRM